MRTTNVSDWSDWPLCLCVWVCLFNFILSARCTYNTHYRIVDTLYYVFISSSAATSKMVFAGFYYLTHILWMYKMFFSILNLKIGEFFLLYFIDVRCNWLRTKFMPFYVMPTCAKKSNFWCKSVVKVISQSVENHRTLLLYVLRFESDCWNKRTSARSE